MSAQEKPVVAAASVGEEGTSSGKPPTRETPWMDDEGYGCGLEQLSKMPPTAELTRAGVSWKHVKLAVGFGLVSSGATYVENGWVKAAKPEKKKAAVILPEVARAMAQLAETDARIAASEVDGMKAEQLG